MVWFLVAQIFSALISLVQIGRLSESEKDLEIIGLRYQLGIAERKLQKPVRATRAERMILAMLAAKLKKQTQRPATQFRQLIRLVPPETVCQERMVENFSVFDFELNDEDMEAILTLDTKESSFIDHRDPEIAKKLGDAKLDI